GVRRSRRPPGHAGDGSLPRLMTPSELLGEPGAAVDEEALRKAEEFIEQEEGAARHFTGWTDRAITTIAVAMSLFHLYAAQAIIAYAFAGPWLPRPWTHRGYDVERLVGHMYMTLEGIFGTAIDVSATFIILFTIYGAVLQFSGAGEFFIDFSLAVTGGSRSAA